MILSALFTGVALKTSEGENQFSNGINLMLRPDWSPQEKQQSSPPDFHFPERRVVGVPFGRGIWRLFWSAPKTKDPKTHKVTGPFPAEKCLFEDHEITNINNMFMNYSPSKNCKKLYKKKYNKKNCPTMNIIWPYRVNTKEVVKKEVKATRKVMKHGCKIKPWKNYDLLIEAICNNRPNIQALCDDVKKAVKKRVFTKKFEAAEDLLTKIQKSNAKKAMEQLKNRINGYKLESYPRSLPSQPHKKGSKGAGQQQQAGNDLSGM